MSGGVDSAVAAALLKKQGYEVIGITMCFNLADSLRKRPTCCGTQGIEDAQRVAHKLGIRHYVLNMQKVLKEKIIKDFCREYFRGRTPNPCVRCNQYIKFDALLKKAITLGATYLATGHYACIENNPRCPAVHGRRYILKKAKDRNKDQSYFLYRLRQWQLKHILFPLGDYTKDEVRRLASEFGLPVADKLASQEICFLSGVDYRGFLKTRIVADIRPGAIEDEQGNVLGQHKGIAFYTIGQREGLGIAKGYPLYITKIDCKKNRIIVGKKEDAYKDEFLVKETNFILTPIKKKIALKVRIRYNHREALAEVMPLGNRIKVRFRRPQFAITPGQSAVFYDKDKVLGGGIIDKVSEGIPRA
jgi:tRNA-specific 2-thiouridylase